MANWDAGPPQGRHRGVAVHRSFNTYVAEIAEVEGAVELLEKKNAHDALNGLGRLGKALESVPQVIDKCEAATEDLQVIQLQCGQDIAPVREAAASQNCVYMVVDQSTRNAAVFDDAGLRSTVAATHSLKPILPSPSRSTRWSTCAARALSQPSRLKSCCTSSARAASCSLTAPSTSPSPAPSARSHAPQRAA